jgi:hypothetical protein
MLPETVPHPPIYCSDTNTPFAIVSMDDIQQELEDVQCIKSVGSDNIPSQIVKLCAAELTHPLHILFKKNFIP